MRVKRLRFCLLCLPCLGAAIAHAQSTADSIYHLHGTVLNGATGRPVGRALVISQDRRLATMTDADGHFMLDVSVPASAAQAQTASATTMLTNGSAAVPAEATAPVLLAQRPGFLQSRQGISIPLNADVSTRDIVLRLMPAASIRGTVTAPGMETSRDVRIQLLRRTVQDGRLIWQMSGSRSPSADGTFVFAGLRPGEYTVVTSEWSPRSFGVAVQATSQQFPPDYLGDTRTLDGATKLDLSYGESATADLHLRQAQYYSVRLPLQGLSTNPGVNVRVAAGVAFQLYQLGWNAQDSSVEGALPDGDYMVTVTTAGWLHGGAQIPLHVADAPVTHAPVGLTPTQEIPVLVRDERVHPSAGVPGQAALSNGAVTEVSTPAVYVSARGEDQDGGAAGSMMQTPNGPVLRGFLPGRYFLQARLFGDGYVAALTCDGVDLSSNALVVNESGRTAPIEVTLRDDAGAISGRVAGLDKSGFSSARILVLPANNAAHALYAYASSTGQFQVANVPPGSYRVLAIPGDSTETLPYLDAEAMRPYQGKGATVSVAPGQTGQVDAQLVEPYVPAGQL